LQDNPTAGISLGNSTYKIRIAIKSKGSGKSGGARVITYVVTAEKEVYLLTYPSVQLHLALSNLSP
jgi:hypothetical protein